MKHVIHFFKGIAIGIANIIPGFSGGTMAVMLRIYDLFVYAFANVFNDFKNVVKKSWSLFLGIIVGFAVAMFTIAKLLEVIPFITIMFFVGLVIGSIPQIFKESKKGKLKVYDVIFFIIAIAILVILPIASKNGESNNDKGFSVSTYIILFLLGALSSSAMVIPGISGSLILMAFGYYTFIMTNIKEWLTNIFEFGSQDYWPRVLLFVCFSLGCIIGLVGVSKLIEKLFNKFPKTIYCTILGLLVASPFSIIYSTITSSEYNVKFDALTIVFSIFSLILGCACVLLSEYYVKKKTSKSKQDVEKLDN